MCTLMVTIKLVVCRTVKKNFRICFIASGGGSAFQRRCREFPNLTKSVNFIWFPHWSKKLLIRHAAFHLRGNIVGGCFS